MTQSHDNPLYEIIIWFWDKITALTFADLLNLPTKYSTHDTILLLLIFILIIYDIIR